MGRRRDRYGCWACDVTGALKPCTCVEPPLKRALRRLAALVMREQKETP